MHPSILNKLPEKNLKEIIKACLQIVWYNFIYPKLYRSSKKDVSAINPEIQKLNLEAHRLKGELKLLETELESLPYLKGCIEERTTTNKQTGKTRTFHRIRWYEDGIRKEKYIVKKKKKEEDLTLETAHQLVANAERAETLKLQIKERKKRLIVIEDRALILTGQKISVLQPLKEVSQTFLIGRDREFAQLQNHLLHNISTLIIGEPGIGKTFLVKTVIESQIRPIIWIENLKAARTVLVDQVIAQLHRDQVLEIENENYAASLEFEDVKKCLKNLSIAQLTDIIKDSIIGHEYIIVIDSMTGLTQSNQVIIEKLLETGSPVLACANKVKGSIDLESLYRKFTKLELERLETKSIRKILQNKIAGLNADNHEKKLLETKIANVACGNPGIAEKMFQDAYALSLGGKLNSEQVYGIQEPDLPRRYFDLTPIVVLSIAGFAVLRFIGMGTNDTLLYIMGGIAFVIFMAFSRIMMKAWTK